MGDVKGMAIQEFINLLYVNGILVSIVYETWLCSEHFHVFDDKFKVRDVREPFFASKMMILDEMASTSQRRIIYFTDFLELLLRVALLRYPPASDSVPDAVHSLEQLFVQHFCAKDQLVSTFRSSADKAIAARLLTTPPTSQPDDPKGASPRSRGSRRTSRKTLAEVPNMSSDGSDSKRQPSR